MPVNKISHNSGMAQLPLAISGKPFTTMKKALFHGCLRVFGEKMNTSVSVLVMFAAKTQDLVVHDHRNPSNSTRVDWLFRWSKLLSTMNRQNSSLHIMQGTSW